LGPCTWICSSLPAGGSAAVACNIHVPASTSGASQPCNQRDSDPRIIHSPRRRGGPTASHDRVILATPLPPSCPLVPRPGPVPPAQSPALFRRPPVLDLRPPDRGGGRGLAGVRPDRQRAAPGPGGPGAVRARAAVRAPWRQRGRPPRQEARGAGVPVGGRRHRGVAGVAPLH